MESQRSYGGLTLAEQCRSLSIKPIEPDYDKFRELRPKIEHVLGVISDLEGMLHNQMTLIGGQTAYPGMLGYKQLRKSSNDIDGVISLEGVEILAHELKSEPSFGYSAHFRGVYFELSGLPVCFFTDRIHDWSIPLDFLDSAVSVSLNNGLVRVASPEYTIALKMRRAKSKGKFYGKDKMDIASLIIAPKFRQELADVDTERTAKLIYLHASSDFHQVMVWINEIQEVERHFTKEEIPRFREAYEQLRAAIEARSGNMA